MKPPLYIDGCEPGCQLADGKGDRCLDLETGAIVPMEGCQPHETGEGRPALQQGKRFVRIPTFDELHQEFKARYDEMEKEAAKDDASIPRTRDYREWADFLNGEFAAEECAIRWIASLRPDRLVAWVDDDVVTQVYDPATGKWDDEWDYDVIPWNHSD